MSDSEKMNKQSETATPQPGAAITDTETLARLKRKEEADEIGRQIVDSTNAHLKANHDFEVSV